MNIWIVNYYANTPSEPGGTRHHSFAREWVAAGHEVLIVASSFHHVHRAQTRLRPGERSRVDEVDGVRYLWLRSPGYTTTGLRRVVSLVSFARKVWRRRGVPPGDRPDVVVGSSPDPFSALAASRVAARFGVPFVYEIRDLWPESLIHLGGMSRRHPAVVGFGRIERHLARRAAAVVSVLPLAGDYLRSRVGDMAEFVWIPNGVDLAEAGEPAPYPTREGTVFVYAGGHGTANALDVIMDAARRLRDSDRAGGIAIRMIGDGPDKPELRRRAADQRLEMMSFEDPLPKSEIFAALGEGDAFVLAIADNDLYRWGYSHNKLFDYMAAARPIVFATSSPYDPVTEAGAGVTVPAEDGAAFAAAMERIAAMPAGERAEMGRRAREYVDSRHATAHLAGRFAEVLAEAARRGPSDGE